MRYMHKRGGEPQINNHKLRAMEKVPVTEATQAEGTTKMVDTDMIPGADQEMAPTTGTRREEMIRHRMDSRREDVNPGRTPAREKTG